MFLILQLILLPLSHLHIPSFPHSPTTTPHPQPFCSQFAFPLWFLSLLLSPSIVLVLLLLLLFLVYN